jgi:LysR family pca operon transcriptional activator
MAPRIIDPRIRLRHITSFLEVARLRSVGRAAEALNVSQPAVSKTILELEQLLGAALFDRSGRTIALTGSGELFLRYAGTSLSALREGIASIRDSQADAVVKVGALPTVSARVLPPAVRKFTARKAQALPRIVTGPNGYLLSLLRQGSVDFVVGRMAAPDEMTGLSFEHLYSERIALIVRPGHPLLSGGQFTLSMLEGYQILMPPHGSVIRPLVEQFFLAHGTEPPRDQVETVSNAFGNAYVRMTDAVWLISEGVVANEIDSDRLAVLPFDTAETLGPVGLTRRNETTYSLAAEMLMDDIRDVAAGFARG